MFFAQARLADNLKFEFGGSFLVSELPKKVENNKVLCGVAVILMLFTPKPASVLCVIGLHSIRSHTRSKIMSQSTSFGT